LAADAAPHSPWNSSPRNSVNGLAYGALLFLMSAGLSLIFGLMNVVNVAHGSFFMIGAFSALAIMRWTDSFWLALAFAWIPAVAMGIVMERVFIRKLYARGHLDQVLLTFGFTFVFVDLVRMIFGPDIRELPIPEILTGVFRVRRHHHSEIPRVPDRLRRLERLPAVALPRTEPRRRNGARGRRRCLYRHRHRHQRAAAVRRNFRARLSGLAAARRHRRRPDPRSLSGMDIEILIPAFIVVVIGGMGACAARSSPAFSSG
jgi:branched-chain amino acid transport system permease protein